MRSLADRPALLLGLGAILAVVAFQLWITPSNPPGYHRDEAALSLNAYTLSTGLRDEDASGNARSRMSVPSMTLSRTFIAFW